MWQWLKDIYLHVYGCSTGGLKGMNLHTQKRKNIYKLNL